MLELMLSSNMYVRSQVMILHTVLELKVSSTMLCERSERLEGSRDLVVELEAALVGSVIIGVTVANVLLCQRRLLEAAARKRRSSHQDVCGLDVAMDTATVVDEAQPRENAVQNVAHAALREAGLLKELSHVDLVQVEHEADVHLQLRQALLPKSSATTSSN